MMAIYSDRIWGLEGNWDNLISAYLIVDRDKIVDITEKKPSSVSVINMAGRVLLPALIDPHTHAIFAGDRADEYHLRLKGVSYEEISKRGGGILQTVKCTRSVSDDVLVNLLEHRLRLFFRMGVLTVEVKTGYGIYPKDELRLLKLILDVSSRVKFVDVLATLLAHMPPKDVNISQFLEEFRKAISMARTMGASFFDVFCDSVGFDLSTALELLRHASDVGLKLKVHAEELDHTGISCKAAQLKAVSADHLIKATRNDFECMREHGTMPVLLPGTAYVLGENITSSLQMLRELQMDFALATDFNPGSCPIISPWLVMSLAIKHFGLSPVEVVRGFTENAARALDLSDRGVVSVGSKAYLIWTGFREISHVGYQFGVNPVAAVIRGEDIMLYHPETWI